MRLGLCIVALTLVLGAASAQAAPFGVAEETAYVEAQAYWQAAPVLCSSVDREVVPPGSLDRPEPGWTYVVGSATEPSQLPAVPCTLYVVSGLSAPRLCAVMRHEYGHLLGYGHDDLQMVLLPLACGPGLAAEEAQAREDERAWVIADWRATIRECKELHRVSASQRWQRRCWTSARHQRQKITARGYFPIRAGAGQPLGA